MFQIDPRVFITNGSGATSVRGAKKYFYLIVRDVDGLEAVDQHFSDGKSGLYRLAAKAGNVLAFAVIDIGANDNLKNNLKFSETAKELYTKIESSLPCIVTSPEKLASPLGVKGASIFALRNLKEDFHRFETETRRITLGDRRVLITAIRKLNNLITIRPSIPVVGVGVNLNEIISKYLDSVDLDKERES